MYWDVGDTSQKTVKEKDVNGLDNNHVGYCVFSYEYCVHYIYGLNIFLSNHPPCFRRWPGRPPPLRTRKTWEKETFSSSRSPLSTKTTTKIFITSIIIIIILIHRGTEHHHHQEDPLSTSDLRENQLQGRLSPPPLTSPSHFLVDEHYVVVDNGDDDDKDDGDDDGDEEEMIAVTICRW